MSMPTITKDGVIFTFQDGDVADVVVNKAGNLDENSMPASDSEYAFVVDFNGVLKTITLSGKLTLAATTRTSTGTVKTVEEQMDWLITLVNGAQTGYTFNSTYQTGKTVYARKVNFRELAGELDVPFTIELVEGL